MPIHQSAAPPELAVEALPPAVPRYRMDPFDPFGDFGQEPVESLAADWTAALLGSSLKRWTLDDLLRYLKPMGGINAQDQNGYTVLMGLAMQSSDPTARGEEPWVNRLLAAGASINHRGHDGHNALSLALLHHQRSLAERLMNAGADPTLMGIDGVPYWIDNTMTATGTPGRGSTVHLALKDPDLLRQVLAAGADPNAPGSLESPLRQALVQGLSAAVLQLLHHGATLPTDPDVPPLLIGLPNLNAQAVQALVRAGADPQARDWRGRAPIDAVMETRPFDDVERLHRRQKVMALLAMGVPANVVLRGQAAVPTVTSLGADLGLGLRPEVPAVPLMHRLLGEATDKIDWALVHHLAQHHDVPLDEAVPPGLITVEDEDHPPRTWWDRVRAWDGHAPQASQEQRQAYRALMDWKTLRDTLDRACPTPETAHPRRRL